MFSEVIIDNKKILLQQIISLPAKLHEQLLSAAIGDDHQHVWQQSAAEIQPKLEIFLLRKRTACLLAYEDNICSEINKFQTITSDKSHNDDLPAGQLETGAVAAQQNKFGASKKPKPLTMAKTQLRMLRNNIYTKIKKAFHGVDNLLRKDKHLTES